MRLNLRLGRGSVVLALVTAVGALDARPAAADTITINDGASPGPTRTPFTCSQDVWTPYMGFVYRNVEAFEIVPGDKIQFDIQMPSPGPADLGFVPQLDIALAHASNPADPFKPDDPQPGASSAFTVVAHGVMAASPGNTTPEDYELSFTVDARFKFSGGGLIIRVSNPRGPLATRSSADCLPVITADRTPSGTNRLVGTFRLDSDGEFPFDNAEAGPNANVPYVRIIWQRCGDGVVSGAEQCDDGNNDNSDDCSIACLAPACGDGYMQPRVEECDNSADPANADPFCDDSCHLAAFAKGSGCEAGGGGLALVLVIGVAFVLRRRGRA